MRDVTSAAPRSAPTSAVGALGEWLRQLVEANGSDLHIKADSPPRIRVRGRLQSLDGAPLRAPDTQAIATAIVPKERAERFEERGEMDFAYSIPGLGRFRVNAFRQRGSCSLVLRQLRIGGPALEEVGLPPIVAKLAQEPRGLVLVTGPTGSGKTTTLAAMIEHINANQPVHIVTIEDPIEVLHPDKQASVNQREVGQDTETFLTAIRAAMRQDPDVILIGEMRDTETVRAALAAAETGHLVLSTLHTVDATSSRPSSTIRSGWAWRGRSGESSASGWCPRRTATGSQRWRSSSTRGGSPSGSSSPRPRPRSPRSSPRARTTACRRSTRRCSCWSSKAR